MAEERPEEAAGTEGRRIVNGSPSIDPSRMPSNTNGVNLVKRSGMDGRSILSSPPNDPPLQASTQQLATLQPHPQPQPTTLQTLFLQPSQFIPQFYSPGPSFFNMMRLPQLQPQFVPNGNPLVPCLVPVPSNIPAAKTAKRILVPPKALRHGEEGTRIDPNYLMLPLKDPEGNSTIGRAPLTDEQAAAVANGAPVIFETSVVDSQGQSKRVTQLHLSSQPPMASSFDATGSSGTLNGHPPVVHGAHNSAPSPSSQMIMEPAGNPPQEATEMSDDQREAAPQLIPEANALNVESLTAKEAFERESSGGSKGKKEEAKDQVEHIDGHVIVEQAEPTNSAHLDAHDFKPIAEEVEERAEEVENTNASQIESQNAAVPAVAAEAQEWMQIRLDMDLPREERKQKPSPTGGKGRKGNRSKWELKSLLQMDFGPRENSRRAKEVLPIVISTAGTTKSIAESVKTSSTQNTRNKERRSNSATDAADSNGKDRSLRNRNSIQKECKFCGNSFDEESADRTNADFCNDVCYSLAVNAISSDEEIEVDEMTGRIKESSKNHSSTRQEKKRERDEPSSSVAKTPKGRGRRSKKEEENVTKIDEGKSEEKQVEPEKPKRSHKRKSIAEKKEEDQNQIMKKQKKDEADGAAKDQLHVVPVVTPPPVVLHHHPPAATTPLQLSQQQPPSEPAPAVEAAPPPAAEAAPAAAVVAPVPHLTPPEMTPAFCKPLTIDQIRTWIEQLTGKPEVAKKFADEDIDGEVLLSLKYEDLRSDLKLSLGMAKRIWTALEEINSRT